MKKLLKFDGLDAIRVAKATNRNVEIQDAGNSAWREGKAWEGAAVASRDGERVRLKGYANVLREAVTGPDAAAVLALIDQYENG